MVIARPSRCRAALTTELVIAMAVLVTAMIPIAYGFLSEIKAARQLYYDALAMQILDGETEILAAGNWKAYPEGEHTLKVAAPAMTNLPPGRFVLTRQPGSLRVEWRPEKSGRRMAREVKLP
jgi:hypothetical protein